MNTDENLMVAVADPDLEIGGVGGGGGGSTSPLDKIGYPTIPESELGIYINIYIQ